MRKLTLLFLFSASLGLLNAQDRFQVIEKKLQELSLSSPGLINKVEFSVNNISIQDFVRGIALSNGLNVSVDPGLNQKIINNFANVTVSEVFIFLAKKYELDITFIGPIINFAPYVAPVIPVKYVSKQVKVSYDKPTDLLTLDLASDSLALVAKELTRISQKNVVFAPDLSGKIVSGYIQAQPFNSALDKLAFANDLKITLTNDNFYLIEKKEKDPNQKNKGNFTSANNNLSVKLNGNLLNVQAVNVPIADIISAVSADLKLNYFLFSEPKGNATLTVTDATYEDFLGHLLNGTDYTFKKQGDIYLFGDRNLEGLRESKLVQLMYRSIEKVIDAIPADLKKGVDIKPFPDLNGIVLSGSQPRIIEIENFIRLVDRVVPVVVIEVMLVDVRNSYTLSTGIEAGLKQTPSTTGGTVYPGVDFTLNAGSLNNIITGINGFGLVNLGNVTPNFYLKIKALEEQGVLKLRSTPQLSTMNGSEASMTIGTTEYYLETQNNVITNQSTQNIVTQSYKPVTADLSLTINPSVSGDEQITLEINVKQSSFTERISPTAPPGTISRDFKSFIRVKNGEMIMLGGLEENSMNETGSGVPVLSRIPILKWFVSSRTKEKDENKLTIFIRPTVVY